VIVLLRIAFRNVLRNRRRSLITFSAVFLTLAVMVSVRGLVNGMSDSIRQSIILGQTGALQVHRRGYLESMNGASLELDMPADEAFMAKVRSVPGVEAAAARIAFGAMANANDTTSPAFFTAVDPDNEPRVCPRRFELVTSGTTLAQAGPASAILTPELAAKLGIERGARATLMAGDRDGALNALDLDYVGAYGEKGLPLPDKKLGFVPLALAQKLLRMENRATEVAVSLKNMDEAEAVKPRLQAAVGPGFEVSTWHDVAPWVDEVIARNQKALDFCAFIFLFVALLGVVNTMLMSVFERTREIGTMMAVGVRRRQILVLFLLEAAFLGLFGGVFGAAVGGGLIAHYTQHGISFRLSNMAMPLHIRPWIDPAYLLETLGLAVFGAVLAALWPALRASRQRPVEALASV
jgi:putative ABC transport system permease protein